MGKRRAALLMSGILAVTGFAGCGGAESQDSKAKEKVRLMVWSSFEDRTSRLCMDFCNLCESWIRGYDIDGIRFDVGNEISHSFLKKMRERVKKLKPDIYLLGEIWHDASQWLVGDEYDSVMNYPLMSGIHDFFIDQTMTKHDFEYMVNHCYTMYMQQCNNVLFNLLDSHDTDRLMNRFHDLDIFYQQLAVLFTMPGSPCIYYGTEIAMEGGHDPDCRRCMPWQELDSEENRQRIAEMKKLISLRKQEPSFKSLYFHFPGNYQEKRCVDYIKLDEQNQKTEVLLNCSEDSIKVEEQGEVLFCPWLYEWKPCKKWNSHTKDLTGGNGYEQ